LSYVLHTELDIFSIIVCALLLYDIYQKREKHFIPDKIFTAILASNIVLLALDALGWFLDGKPGSTEALLYIVLMCFYYIMNPVPPYLWSLYADYLVFNDENRIRKLLLPFLIPVIIIAVLTLATPYTNLMFYMDKSNIYHRGPWFPLLVIMSYSYFLYTFVIVLRNRNKIEKSYFLPLSVFILPPLIGGILQAYFYGLSLIWSSLTISLLIVYLYIQNNKLNTDYLTGLYNRMQLDRYLQSKIRNKDANRNFSGILIDIDNFKTINDQYGHLTGDEALEITAELLRSSLRKNDFLARYGGDEFIIILDIQDFSVLEKSAERIRTNIKNYNLRSYKPYQLSLSMGYDVYDRNTARSADDFLKHIDSLMYNNKKEK